MFAPLAGHALTQLWACFAAGNYGVFLNSGLVVFTFGLLRVRVFRIRNEYVCMDACVSMYVCTLSLFGLPT